MPETSHYAGAYTRLFGTIEVTEAQVNYHYLVDKYRNVMILEKQLQTTEKLLGEERTAQLRASIGSHEISALDAGAAAAKGLGYASTKEASQLRFLQDVKKLYPDIDQFKLFNQRMALLEKIPIAENPQKITVSEQADVKMEKPIKTRSQHLFSAKIVGPAIVAGAFYAGASATEIVAKRYVSAQESLKTLNLPETERRDYQALAAQVETKVLAAERLAQGRLKIPNVERFFGSELQFYREWAARNKLNAQDQAMLDPVTPGMQRAIMAQQGISASTRAHERP